MENTIFRPIEKSDIEDVFLLLNQLKKLDIYLIDRKKAWKDFHCNTSSNSVVGIYQGIVVAYGSIVIENKIRGEVAGHIEDIVVDEKVKGKMLGTQLVKELIKVGEAKGCYRISLFCDKKLVKFYERNGFKVNNVMMKRYIKNS